MALTGVFSFLDLQVVSASIKTGDAGFIHDEFVVQSQDGSIVCSTHHLTVLFYQPGFTRV